MARPPAEVILLGRKNRKLAEQLGTRARDKGRGGFLLYGCEGSGRREVIEAAGAWLPDTAHVSLSVKAQPRDELNFLRKLGIELTRELAKSPGLGGTATPEHLDTLRQVQDPLFALETLREVILALPAERRPILSFYDLDCVGDTHVALDGCFAALRELVNEAKLICFTTAYQDPPRGAPGVSHFVADFLVNATHPVDHDDLVAALTARPEADTDSAAVATIVLASWGSAETWLAGALERFHIDPELLRRPLDESPDEWSARLSTACAAQAAAQLDHEANQFWDRLDRSSRATLCRSVAGTDSPRDAVATLVAHPWSRFSLVESSPGRVRVFNAALIGRARRELAAEALARMPEVAEQLLSLTPRVLGGNPESAIYLLERLGARADVTAGAGRRIEELLAAARVLDLTIKGRVRDAAKAIDATLTARYPCLLAVQQLLRDVARISARDDVKTWLDHGATLGPFFAVELWRAERRRELGDFGAAIKELNNTIDSILTLALHQLSSPVRPAPPDDALEFFCADMRRLMRGRKRPDPVALPERADGPTETFALLRAYDHADLRELSDDELRSCGHVLQYRNKTSHRPTDDDRERADRTAEVAELLVPRIAGALGLTVIDARQELILPPAFCAALRGPL